MKKVYLYDDVTDGHHKKYNSEVLKVENSNLRIVDVFSRKQKIIKNKYLNELNKTLKIFALLINTTPNSLFHFLYLDNQILQVYLLYKLKMNKKISFSGTLHWHPNNELKKKMLIYLYSKGFKVICHTPYIIEQQKKLGDVKPNQLYHIDYPYFPYENNKKEKIELSNKLMKKLESVDKIKILYFGGTRYDKGLDILLQSLGSVRRHDISIFIIGKEEFFKEDYIKDQLKHTTLDVNLHLNFVNESTAHFIFKNINYTVLPYRRIFAGQSGPLIDSLANNKKVICPNTKLFLENNKHNDDVLFYEVEDVNSLSNLINELKFQQKETHINRDSHLLNLKKFQKSYMDFLKD